MPLCIIISTGFVFDGILNSYLDIPHFRQVVVMATTCEYCGSRSNEVKAGTGVSEYGTKITLHLTDRSDLSRDILKVNCIIIIFFNKLIW